MDKSVTEKVIQAHVQWFTRLRVSTKTGQSEFDPLVVKRDSVCDFGRWLYGDCPAEFKASPAYARVRKLHAEFHVQAGSVLALALKGKRDEALRAIDGDTELRRTSLALIAELRKLA